MLAVTGACLMVKRSLFEELGGLDEDYIYGLEDVDFSLKLHENGYKTKTLFYYNDHVVTDDRGKVLSENSIEKLIGKESLTTFGQYESDSVFVRNDELETDYEILRDTRNFSDVVNKNAHPEGDE